MTAGSGPVKPAVTLDGGPHAAPGGTAAVRVHVRNDDRHPQAMTVAVLGLDGEWLPAPLTTAPVDPQASVTVELHVRVGDGAVPGTYPFVVAVQAGAGSGSGGPGSGRSGSGGSGSGRSGSDVAVVDADLRVDAPSEVMLGVEPAETSAVLGQRLTVVLTNGGTDPVGLDLSALADVGMRVRLSRRAVVVPAQGSARVRVKARIVVPRLLGHRNRRRVRVSAVGREHAPLHAEATVTSRPLLGPGVVKVVAVVAVAALWLGGSVVGLPWLSQQFQRRQDAPDTVTLVEGKGAEATGAAGQGGGTGAKGTNGKGGSSEGKAGAGSRTGTGTGAGSGVRVAGLVTAADPAGFTVRIAPASGDLDDALAMAPSDTQTLPGDAAAVQRAAALPVKVAAWAAPAAGRSPATRNGPQGERRTTTLADGSWAFAGLSPTTTYLITLAKRGFQTRRYAVTGAAAAKAPLEVAMRAGSGRLSGRVGLAPNGPGAVPGATITVSDGLVTASTTSREHGEWSLEGLATPATYVVTVTAARLGVQVRVVRLAAAGSRSVDVVLSPAVTDVTGTVRANLPAKPNAPVGGLTVTVSGSSFTRTVITLPEGDASPGTFVVPDVPMPGQYTMTVSGPGWATTTRVLDLPGAAVLGGVTVTRAGFYVTGTVQLTGASTSASAADLAGVVLSNAEHVYKTTAQPSEGAACSGTATSTPDEQPVPCLEYELDGVAPGSYLRTVERAGYGSVEQPVTVPARQDDAGKTDLGQVTLTWQGPSQRSGRIRLLVRDAATRDEIDCSAPSACEITIEGSEVGTAISSEATATASPDPAHGVVLPLDGGALFPGHYRVTVSAPHYLPQVVEVDVAGQAEVTAPTAFLTRRPEITGTVVSGTGFIPPGTLVQISREGSAKAEKVCGADTCSGVTWPRYRFPDLVPGTYTLQVVPPEDGPFPLPQRVRVTVAAGQVLVRDLSLDRAGQVVVTASTDVTGTRTLVSNASATLVPAGSPSPDVAADPGANTATTDAQGRVVLVAPSPGDYRVRLTATVGGIAVAGQSAVVTIGINQDATVSVDLVRSVGESLTSRLSAALAAPFPAGVSVSFTGLRRTHDPLAPLEPATEATTTAGGGTFTLPTSLVRIDSLKVSDDRFAEVLVANPTKQQFSEGFVLRPLGRAVSSGLTIDGHAPGDLAAAIDIDVVATPPGAEATRVRVDADGAVHWVDPAEPQPGPTATPTVDDHATSSVRPGMYRLRATLADHATLQVDVAVPLRGAAMDPVDLRLHRYADLVVQVFSTVGGQRVDQPVVTLHRESAGDVTVTGTAADGRVSFGPRPPGEYGVSVRAAGFSRAVDERVVLGEAARTVPIALHPLWTVRGTVLARRAVDGSTRPLAGADVTLTSGDRELEAITDSAGRYVLGTGAQDGPGQGAWTLTMTAPGFPTRTTPLHLTEPVQLPAGASGLVEDVSFTVEPDPVTVVVDVLGASGVADASVDDLDVLLLGPFTSLTRALTCSDGPRPQGCPSGPHGRYTFTDVPPDVYTLSVSGDGFAPLVVTVSPEPDIGIAVTLSLAVPRVQVRGTVVAELDGTRTPLGGATVQLMAENGYQSVTTSRADGAFVTSRVPAGDYVLRVSCRGYLSSDQTLPLQGPVGVVPVVLHHELHPVTVTLASVNGYDLSGTKVRLSGGPVGAAVQERDAVRGVGDGYQALFTQVASGQWRVEAIGIQEHRGSWSGSVTVGDSPAAVTIPVAETKVSVVARSGDPGAPTSVPFRIADVSGTSRPLVLTGSVAVGGEEDFYLDAETSAWEVTVGAAPDGWRVSPARVSAAAGAAELNGVFTLTPIATPTPTPATPAATAAARPTPSGSASADPTHQEVR